MSLYRSDLMIIIKCFLKAILLKFYKWIQVQPSPQCPDRTGFWKEIPNPEDPEVPLAVAFESYFGTFADDLSAPSEQDDNRAVTILYDRNDIEFLQQINNEPFVYCDHSVATMLEFDSATPIHRITAQERHALLKEIRNIKGNIKLNKKLTTKIVG